MKNPAAHAALQRFCEDALAQLREAVPKQGHPPVYWRWTYRFSDTGRTGEQEEMVDWPEVLREYLGDPTSIHSWTAALAEFEADPRLSGRRLTVEQPPLTIKGFLVRLVSQQGSLRFDSRVFDPLYQETEDYFYQDTVTYRYLAPLSRFSTEEDEILLDSGLSIVEVPNDWRQEMLDASVNLPQLAAELEGAASTKHGLVLYLQLQKEQGEEVPRRMQGHQEDAIKHVRNVFRLVCSALRLFKAGAVGYEQVIPRPTSWVPWRSAGVWGGGLPSSLGERYVFSEEEAAGFAGFWPWYRDATTIAGRTVSLALRRFNMAYARGSDEDRLVDFMIAFEALLLQNERSKRRILANRVAALLSENPDERTAIREELEAAYEQRNKILHDGEADKSLSLGDGTGVTLGQLNARVEERLRGAIQAAMKREPRQDKAGLVEELDRRIAEAPELRGKAKK
jgi:hypothetical protein